MKFLVLLIGIMGTYQMAFAECCTINGKYRCGRACQTGIEKQVDRVELNSTEMDVSGETEIQIFFPAQNKVETFMCCREMQCCRGGCCS